MAEEKQQVFDSTLKALLEDQTLTMLSLMMGDVEYLEEVSESALKPSLRLDRAYLVRRRGKQEIVHIEFETDAASNMPARMLEYYGILFRRHRKPITSIIVCPFRTTIPDSPLRIISEDGEVLVFHYRLMRLWEYDIKEFLSRKMVGIYALLPTMSGATYELLVQALDEMKEHFVGKSRKLAEHLLWFGTFLRRTDTVTIEDKRRIEGKMSNLESLLDENPFVQKRKAEGLAEGLVKGHDEGLAEGLAKGHDEGLNEGLLMGEARGLQRAVLTLVEGRFPPLAQLAHERVPRVNKPEALDIVFRGILVAPDEATARLLLNLLAA